MAVAELKSGADIEEQFIPREVSLRRAVNLPQQFKSLGDLPPEG